MKVVHVVQRFHPEVGGAETHVRALAREQAKLGHDVTVATSGAGESQLEGYRVVRFPAKHWKGDYLFPPWLVMDGLEDFLVDARADILHAHSYRFHTLEAAAAASSRCGSPLVVTAHGFYPPENPLVALARWRYDRERGRKVLAQAKRCIAVTAHEVAHYAQLGVPASRVDVVPNGIDATAFDAGDGAAFRKAHDLGDGPLVVFLARLAHDKGLFDLVRAARGLGATVAVCGRDAGSLARAQRLAPQNVRFVGPVPDPRDAYAAADVFCVPSHYEAFGLVFLEAMAQRRAVVATTAGGMPEVVGEGGVCVRPRDPPALRAALTDLLASPALRASLGEAGALRARSFLWKDVVARLEDSYRRAWA